MNSVYESLRTLLRNKELEIKKLEKEIEALRIVLPIVAEAGESALDSVPTFESPRPIETAKAKQTPPGPDFDNMMAQVKATQGASSSPAPAQRPTPITENVPSKPRTSWP